MDNRKKTVTFQSLVAVFTLLGALSMLLSGSIYIHSYRKDRHDLMTNLIFFGLIGFSVVCVILVGVFGSLLQGIRIENAEEDAKVNSSMAGEPGPILSEIPSLKSPTDLEETCPVFH